MHFQNSKLSFFHKQCVIQSFLPSFNEFHHNFHIFTNFRYHLSTTTMRKKVTTRRHLPLNFPKYNELDTSPKLVNLFLKDKWYSDACKISTDSDAKCKGSESRLVAHRKSHWEAKWVKSWASWNITYNTFPELQTKFFHKQCVIWSFLPSFKEFHHKLHILQISGTILQQLTIRKKVTTKDISH